MCVLSHLLDDTHALLLDISLAVGRTMASYILFFNIQLDLIILTTYRSLPFFWLRYSIYKVTMLICSSLKDECESRLIVS